MGHKWNHDECHVLSDSGLSCGFSDGLNRQLGSRGRSRDTGRWSGCPARRRVAYKEALGTAGNDIEVYVIGIAACFS
jgi:hypothetical protein